MVTMYDDSTLRLAGDDAILTPTSLFRLQQTCDGDLWPIACVFPLFSRPGATTSGRYRVPFAGGGSSDKVFLALFQLLKCLKEDNAANCGCHQEDLLPVQPHTPRPYIERHMDDQHGFFGMHIERGGDVVLTVRDGFGKQHVSVRMSPQLPYPRSYAFMPTIWYAIRADNRKLGDNGTFRNIR